jgi:hypothetical protein
MNLNRIEFMRDLVDPRWMKLKAVLFLFLGFASTAAILLVCRSWRVAFCLAIAIWSFCRLYYFAFYVIEHYVEPGWKFSGLGSFIRYMLARRRRAKAGRE